MKTSVVSNQRKVSEKKDASVFVPFASIHQFRHTKKAILETAAYVGQDENDEPILDYTLPKPKLTFSGGVKCHGSNGGIGYNPEQDYLWVQSRKKIITPERDNAGFAFFVEQNKEVILNFMRWMTKEYKTGLLPIMIYGEWCGGNIQKGIALNGLPKMFILFDRFKVITPEYEENANIPWRSGHRPGFPLTETNIYFIEDFPTFEVEIDFESETSVAYAVNKMVEITQEVEKECPVGKQFGVSGIGEGVVWRCDDQVFKVKGEKHSVSKVKTLAAADPEKMASLEKFVDYAVTNSRLEQGVKEVYGEQKPGREKIADFLRWVHRDIIKEEMDVMVESNIEPKEVGKMISNEARRWFFEQEAK